MWPVGERMSPTQRALYDVVHAALRAATAEVRPGAEYRDVHRRACLTLAEGLREVGSGRVCPVADPAEADHGRSRGERGKYPKPSAYRRAETGGARISGHAAWLG